jgi:hypothetical protein
LADVDSDDVGKFFVDTNTLTKAQACKTMGTYTTTLLQGFFKYSITIFCTCNGSGRGKSADGQERAGLPKAPFNVFIGVDIFYIHIVCYFYK